MTHAATIPIALLTTRPWTPAQVAEALDALARRQREIPSWVLAECPATPATAPRPLAAVERALLTERLPALLDGGVRAVVSIGGPVRPADAASVPGWLPAGAAVHRVTGDPALRVLVPAALPRPRLFVLLDNALGGFGTVGAVRVLRAVRAAMTAHDRLLLALDTRDDRAAIEDDGYDAAGALAARHLAALAALNRALGADFDVRRFAYRVTYEPELRRAETHLVATTAMRVTIARRGAVAIGRGESLRTAVECTYDRPRADAMLAGVGLALDDWTTDARGRVALATASPAR